MSTIQSEDEKREIMLKKSYDIIMGTLLKH
jgi:hypothetical protein